MKRIQYHKYGGAEKMNLEKFELSAPKRKEVVVAVKAASINPIDWKVRFGELKFVTGRSFPKSMGIDFSGRVLEIGEDVTLFKPGDEVFGMATLKNGGAFAPAIIAQENLLTHKPNGISFQQAACFGTPFVTAWNGLIDKAQLQAGQRVFLIGCMGSVGQAALQIALRKGATVVGSCSAGDVARATELGLESALDYRALDLSTIQDQFDVIVDTSGSLAAADGLRLVKCRGVFVDIHPTPAKFVRAVFNRRLKVAICEPRAEILDEAAQASAAGQLRMAIGKVVPLEGAIELITDLEKGQRIKGKGVILMDDPGPQAVI